MAFDPAKYIAEKSGASTGGFDPAKYLAEKSALAEDHGLAAELTHKAASYLPVAGGFGGAILGGIGGAAVGAPAGPAAIATSALGAGVGGAMGGAAGKGLQHVIDTALGYEQPIATADDLGSRVGDMGKAAFEEGKNNAVGTAIGGVAMPVIRPVARAIANGASSGAAKLAARVVGGTAGEYRAAGVDKVADMGRFLLDEGAVSPTSMSLGAVKKRLPNIEAQAGQDLSNSISALDATGQSVSKGDLAKRFYQLAAEKARMGPGADPIVKKYLAAGDRVVDDIFDNGGKMSFADAEAWKRGYQEPINYSKVHRTPLEMGQQELASASRQGVEDAAAQTASTSGNPQLEQAFLNAKKRSGLAQTASEMAEGGMGRAEARNLIGPVARMGGWVGATTALAHGNVPAALASVAAPPVAQYLKSRSVGAMAVGLNATAKSLSVIARTEPWRLGPYAGILAGALNNGSGNEDEFNARSYALSQTEPGFQAITKQLAEQK